MDGLKGIVEIVEHLVYELLGLVVPGAFFVLGCAYVWEPLAAADIVMFAHAEPVLALGGAYAIGYIVQGASRFVTGLFRWILQRPNRTLAWFGRVLLPSRWESAIAQRISAAKARIIGSHRHRMTLGTGDEQSLTEIAEQRWRTRLGTAVDRPLSTSQVRDLSFSAILPETHRLDRFRAATSLCRGLASTIALCAVVLLVKMSVGREVVSLSSIGWLAALIFSFAALMERADMYNELWSNVLLPQFLAFDTKRQPPDSKADKA